MVFFLTTKARQDLYPSGTKAKTQNLKASMVNRQIKLLSEEWEALLFIQTQEQGKTGKRPSVNEVIGKTIMTKAKDIGYQDDKRQINR
jgi:hypothetical protein